MRSIATNALNLNKTNGHLLSNLKVSIHIIDYTWTYNT